MDQKILKYIDKGSVMAIIPARSGSKGIKDKNIRLLGGYPLIAYSIVVARLCSSINRILVSTDSKEYADIANLYGAETPFLRPAELSKDSSTDLEFMIHIVQWLYVHEKKVPEYFVHLRPTSPARNPKVINEAIDTIKSDSEATCLRTICGLGDILTPFKWYKKNEHGYLQSLFFERNDEANVPRQSFPEAFYPNGYVDILTASSIISDNYIHGDRMLSLITPDGGDIDEENSFITLNNKIQRLAPQIYEYLCENF
ncbi:acylneuraminate cytidylyltransferase family protein [Aminipila sp.]|uniref:acylneuraminate cytidylyltransferase family protein n=1 Tax=Aminipila sp. TaxID=2060095 RepID=UPI00289F1079|nr:acylneuraminate cytidylyltransferase family protein [Aminipila sp.]